MEYRNRLNRAIGIWRSQLIYYGVPFRRRRLAKFYGQFIASGDLCFDIGSHVGNRIRAFNDLSANVVAVEPQPECMRVLRKTYGANSQVVLVEKAIGASCGNQQLFISPRTPAVSTLSKQWISTVEKIDSFAHVQWQESISVEVTTLDDLIKEYGEPAFCKIDVEGYEHQVLLGLTIPIRILSFEYTPADCQGTLDCMNRLNDLGQYQFNWSVGESHRLQSEQWLGQDAMSQILQAMARDEKSGDIYARLKS